MGKVTNIGSRIHSVERGNVVAGANEILDDAKGKKQNVINNDVDAELVRLDQSKQNNLTFDNTPMENSNNPVKSGGVYAAYKALSEAIEAILILIPSAATALNQLADKNFVNSSIATDTATFRGTSATGLSEAQFLEWANGLTHDMNDYVFWQTIDEAGNTLFMRYKWNGTQWLYEYTLNNSSFTADQWAAITSGITTALVEKLVGLPTNAALQQALNSKQDTLTFDNVPTEGSNNPVKSGGVYRAVKAEEDARLNLAQTVSGIGGDVSQIEDVIPASATAQNKLVANASMEAYVASIIQNITASFTITTTDGHINLTLTQVDGQVATLTLTSSDIASAQALTALTGRVTTAEGNITSLTGRVSTNETDIANLQQLYNDLQQSKPVPVTALPSTGQQQGVIYRLAGTTSYSDYMWDGSTWVLMATYNNAVDPRPKKASQNLVTSGGVFDNIGALDVSELNATENPHTLAQYVDLSAALAAIPTDYQKGGMSIKFIQSSDNKYVQYLNTSSMWTTNVLYWVKVNIEKEVKEQIFNLDSGELVYDTEVYVAPDSESPVILDYLGKKECTIIVDGTNVSSNKFNVTAKNKATGSVFVLYNAQNGVNLPIEFANPESNLELIDIKIGTFSTSSADIFKVEFKKIVKEDSPVVDSEKIVSSKGLFAKFSDIDSSFNLVYTNSVSHHYYKIQAGKKYIFKNNGTGPCNIFTRNTIGGENVETVATNLTTSSPIEFTAGQNANYIYCPQAVILNISNRSNAVNTLADEVYNNSIIEKDYTDYYISGGYYTLNGGGGSIVDVSNLTEYTAFSRCIIKVKKGDIVKVSGTGGGSPRLIALTDDSFKIYSEALVASPDYDGELTYTAIKDGYAISNHLNTGGTAQKYLKVITSVSTQSLLDLNEENLSSKLDNNLAYSRAVEGYSILSYHIEKGERYKVVNTSSLANTAMLLALREEYADRNAQIVVNGLYNSIDGSAIFTAPFSTEKIYIYINKNNGSFTIEKIGTVDNRLVALESEPKNVLPSAGFDLQSDTIGDMTSLFASMDYTNGMYQTDVIEQIYANMDKLVALYPDVIKKYDPMASANTTQQVVVNGQTYNITIYAHGDIKTAMTTKGFSDYPEYAKGISSPVTRTFDVGDGTTYDVTYEQTPAYKTYMYVVSSPNSYLNNDPHLSRYSYEKKKVFIVSGTHGNEKMAPFDVYALASQLCSSIDYNFFSLRESCDFYLIPFLNGYGCYHTMRPNANWVDINRSYPVRNWGMVGASELVEPRNPLSCSYSGSEAGNQFETALVMSAIETIHPTLGIDHHNYGAEGTVQFYTDHAAGQYNRPMVARCAIDVSQEFIKKMPTYFGNKPKVFIGERSIAADRSQTTTSWMAENSIPMAFTIEIGATINYIDGEVNDGNKPAYNTDVANVAEYTFRHQLLVYLDWILKHLS